MAETTEIKVFECDGCGRRLARRRAPMPVEDSGVWRGNCGRCGEEHHHTIRRVRIAAADWRYARRFVGGDSYVLDVTEWTL